MTTDEQLLARAERLLPEAIGAIDRKFSFSLVADLENLVEALVQRRPKAPISSTDQNPFLPGNNRFRKCLKGHADYSASFDECPSCKAERNRTSNLQLTVDQAVGMLTRCSGHMLPKEKADQLVEYIKQLDYDLDMAHGPSGPPALETTTAQAPIAKITVYGHLPPAVTLYAPGLPPGEHDVYCEAGAKDETSAGPARVFADADNNGRDARVLIPAEKTDEEIKRDFDPSGARSTEKATGCQFCDGLGHEAQKKCTHCDGSGLNGSASNNPGDHNV